MVWRVTAQDRETPPDSPGERPLSEEQKEQIARLLPAVEAPHQDEAEEPSAAGLTPLNARSHRNHVHVPRMPVHVDNPFLLHHDADNLTAC